MLVYISTAGRPFVRLRQASFGSFRTGTMSSYATSSMRSDTAPGQSAVNDHVDFEGHSIVVFREFQSGARRIAIDFDGRSRKLQGRRYCWKTSWEERNATEDRPRHV